MTVLAEIKQLLITDLKAVDRLIIERLHSDVALVNQLGHYIVASGGKRLRPLLTVLCAKAAGYEGNNHRLLAVIIEFIHTATLLHDDVVDDSSLRRGHETANELFGAEASVLVGDFLYSRAFQMMVEVKNMTVMKILSLTTNLIAEGEVLQLMNCNDPETTEDRYFKVITCKTAKLFEAACQLGAVVNQAPAHIESALAGYGLHLGRAFQLIDDSLDYQAESGAIGKNIGDDLAEGKPTLPLIYAMEHGSLENKKLIKRAIKEGGLAYLDEIKQIIQETGAIEYTLAKAQKEVDLAIAMLSKLEDSQYTKSLIKLAKFSLARTN